DDFSRLAQSPPLAPWKIATGKWSITNGVLRGTASGENDFADLYVGSADWTDYCVEGRVQLPANQGAFQAGLSGRVDPLTGRRYLIAIQPEDSPAGGST